jgi:hypothetical protein
MHAMTNSKGRSEPTTPRTAERASTNLTLDLVGLTEAVELAGALCRCADSSTATFPNRSRTCVAARSGFARRSRATWRTRGKSQSGLRCRSFARHSSLASAAVTFPFYARHDPQEVVSHFRPPLQRLEQGPRRGSLAWTARGLTFEQGERRASEPLSTPCPGDHPCTSPYLHIRRVDALLVTLRV